LRQMPDRERGARFLDSTSSNIAWTPNRTRLSMCSAEKSAYTLGGTCHPPARADLSRVVSTWSSSASYALCKPGGTLHQTQKRAKVCTALVANRWKCRTRTAPAVTRRSHPLHRTPTIWLRIPRFSIVQRLGHTHRLLPAVRRLPPARMVARTCSAGSAHQAALTKR
jgi:hypothetical protein